MSPGAGPSGAGGVVLGTSRGLCRQCRAACEVRYVADQGGIYLERLCPTDCRSRALVAESLGWYREALAAPSAARRPQVALRPHTGPCPASCGPCAAHAQRCQLPVLSITNACELRCPICFTYNRSDQLYFMSAAELARQLDYLVAATGGVDLINITGGEPTLHPELAQLLQLARRPEIGRVTLNSNGLRLGRDPELGRMLRAEGVYVVLSLDTLDPERSRRIHGCDIVADKLRALDMLARFDIPATLLMVLVGGVNEQDLAPIVELALERSFVRSLTIQTMTYTGQGGGTFLPRRHLPVEGVERRIEQATEGRVRRSHFVPLPTAHPLCYGVAYLLRTSDGGVYSFSEILGRETLARHLGAGYLLHPSPELEQALRDAIDRLWSEGGSEPVLAALKRMLGTLYPPGEVLGVHERQRRAEQAVKTIYVHAHMDEDTYDVARAMRCPDQVPIDAERLVGACNYNLFFRMRDPRFWLER